MSGFRCPACGLVNFATSDTCRRCGTLLAAGQGVPASLPLGTPPPPTGFSPTPPPLAPFSQAPPSGSFGDVPAPPSSFSPDQAPSGPFSNIGPPAGGFANAAPTPGAFSHAPPTPGGFGNAPPPPVAYIHGPPPEAAPYARASSGESIQQAPYGYPVARSTNLRQGMAITSLVLGCLSPFSCALLGIGSIVGIVLGIVATAKAQRYPAQYGGKTMAIIGIALNGFSIVIVVPIVMAIAIPNLLLSRMAANEASAIGTLRTIQIAEATYQSTRASHQEFGNLDQLIEAGLLGRGSQLKSGYRFDVRPTEIRQRWSTEYRFEAFATPLAYYSTGRRSFYTCQDSVIRGADKSGRQAGSVDPPINQ